MMKNSNFFQSPGFFGRLIFGSLLCVTILLGLSLLDTHSSPIAHADGGQANFALQPVLYDPSNPLTESYFIFDSKPGIVITSRVRVTNSGTATGSALLYPVDATTGQT